MDPCWNVSMLIRFDLPKPYKDNTNFGVHCDLNICIYDYERIWIFLDTTDTLPTETFQCPRPYIDTCFLKVLKDINIFTKLLRNRNDATSKLFNKKIQFFKDICYEQVFKKMKRLLMEMEHNNIKDSTFSKVYDHTYALFEKSVDFDVIIKKIETEINLKSPLGILFNVLGTIEDIILFNNTTKTINTSRSEKSLLNLIKIFSKP